MIFEIMMIWMVVFLVIFYWYLLLLTDGLMIEKILEIQSTTIFIMILSLIFIHLLNLLLEICYLTIFIFQEAIFKNLTLLYCLFFFLFLGIHFHRLHQTQHSHHQYLHTSFIIFDFYVISTLFDRWLGLKEMLTLVHILSVI